MERKQELYFFTILRKILQASTNVNAPTISSTMNHLSFALKINKPKKNKIKHDTWIETYSLETFMAQQEVHLKEERQPY